MSPAPLTFYEFFAGGGMARLGLGQEWQCLFANDFDPMKAEAYRANFGDEHLHEGDVWSLSARDLPGRADLAWASSPCQDFSLAGERAGLRGGRSSAFFGFWSLVEQLSLEGRAPRLVVVENVVGLLTSHGGRDFAALCEALKRAGYRFGALEIDAARFVPQSRPRIFIVATQGDAPVHLTQIEPTLPFHSKRIATAFEGFSAALKSAWVWWRLPYPEARNEALDSVLESDADVSWLSQSKTDALIALLGPRHQEKLAAAKLRRERTVGALFRRMRTVNGKAVQRAELRFDGVAGCLRTPGGGSSKQFLLVVQGDSVGARKLTARESARLMSLSDDYKLPARDTASLRVLGDGVVVDVVSFLRSNLLERLVRLEVEEGNVEAQERRRARA